MENYSEKIQDFIDGTLTEEERLDFENEMTKNADLREETALQQRLHATLSKHLLAEKAANELTKTLDAYNKRYFPVQKKAKGKSIPFRQWALSLSAAASIALILVLSGVFSSSNLDQLPTMPSEITRGMQGDAELQKGIAAYNNKQYETSTLIFHQLIQNNSKPGTTIPYYLGLSYLGEKNYKMAVSFLEPIAQGISVYQQDAQYFTGLAYYHDNTYGPARLWLQKVSEDSRYHKNAQQLLKKIPLN